MHEPFEDSNHDHERDEERKNTNNFSMSTISPLGIFAPRAGMSFAQRADRRPRASMGASETRGSRGHDHAGPDSK
jgi:hypothetical protein